MFYGSKINLVDFFAGLIAQYKKLQQDVQQNNNAYRILEVKDENGCIELTIHIIGRNITFKSTPKELAANDALLNGFSRQDVRTITFLATSEMHKPNYEISSYKLCKKTNKMLFSLKKSGNNKVITKTADIISSDKELLQQISQSDAHMIGYTTAIEKGLIEKRKIAKIISAESNE